MKKLSFAVLLLTGCATGIDPYKYNQDPAAVESFTLCHGYSCTSKTPTGFTAVEWKQVGSLFSNPAKTPEDERSRIGQALALMERQIGAKTRTDEDDGAAVTRRTSTHQLDCIDETINTTHYVGFLQKAGWLKFHEITDPTHRGYFIDGRWPHNTAVIREKDTGVLWAVDSFYRANGEEPYILPRADWLAGWKPPGATQ